MILVGVYVGGRINLGAIGAERGNPAWFSFPATKETTFECIRTAIYRHLGISRRQYSLTIRARYNTSNGRAHHLSLIPVGNETEWRMIFHMTVSEMKLRMVELCVDCDPSETRGNLNLFPDNCQPGTSTSFRDDKSVSSDSTLSSPEPVVMRSPIRDNIEIGGDINIENDESIEEDSDSVDDSLHYQPNQNLGRRLVVTGRSERQHPVRASSSEIDNLNVESSQGQFDNLSSANRAFNSKEQLQYTINEFDERKNTEFIMNSSNNKNWWSNVVTLDDSGDVSGPDRKKCPGSQSARHSISVPTRLMNSLIDTIPGSSSSQRGFQTARNSISGPPVVTDAHSRTIQGALAGQPLRKSLGGRIRSFLRGFSSRGRS